jgi:hypothetical protein
MNNFQIEIPWWAGMIFLVFVLIQTGLWTFYAYEALLKFLIVWRHGFPPAHCDALGDSWEEEKEVNNG